MINAIVTGIFFLITKIANMILYPIIAVVCAMFPDLAQVINNVYIYLNVIIQFIPLALDFLMIPRGAIVLLFDYYIIKYSIYLSTRAYSACVTLYNKYKL